MDHNCDFIGLYRLPSVAKSRGFLTFFKWFCSTISQPDCTLAQLTLDIQPTRLDMPHELGDRANPDYIAGFLDGHTHHQERALYCSLTQEEESLKLFETH